MRAQNFAMVVAIAMLVCAHSTALGAQSAARGSGTRDPTQAQKANQAEAESDDSNRRHDNTDAEIAAIRRSRENAFSTLGGYVWYFGGLIIFMIVIITGILLYTPKDIFKSRPFDPERDRAAPRQDDLYF